MPATQVSSSRNLEKTAVSRLSRVPTLSPSVIDSHGRHSLTQHSLRQVWHKRFRVLARLLFKAVALRSVAIIEAVCHTCDGIARMASETAEEAELQSRKDSTASKEAEGCQHGPCMDQGGRLLGATVDQGHGWGSRCSANRRGCFRPIGLRRGIFRVWSKFRRQHVQTWQNTKADRPAFAGSRGRTSVRTVWRQAVRAESAVGARGRSVSDLTCS